MLGVALALILAPRSLGMPFEDGATGSRVGFAAVALWWGLFAIPLFRRVPEPPRRAAAPAKAAWREAFGRLRGTFAALRSHPQALRMLVAFLLFNDGIGTIIRVATIYGAERNLPDGHLIAAILLVQVVGVPCSFAFGWLAGRIGAKRCVLLGIGVYFVISALAFFMETTAHFYALAFLVATVQGGTQALARSLFASLVPRERTAEFFGFFGVAERFAGVLGPPTFALGAWIGGASRWGVAGVVPFFVLGAIVLAKLDVARGRAEARAA
jgi:UMF1 family MFS transporter